MQLWQKFKKPLIAIIILAISFVIFAILKATKPQPPVQTVVERSWPVTITAVKTQDIRPEVSSYGEIYAGQEAELRAQVSGTVVYVHPELGDGQSVHAGDVLVRIDDFNYRATMRETQAKLEELQAVLAGEEKLLPGDKKQVALAQRELDRQTQLLKRSAVSKKAYDDALSSLNDRQQSVLVREQTISRIKSQIVQAESSFEKAQRDVEDTRLSAPFDGFLSDMDVTNGKQVSTSDRLGRLISLQRLEVAFHLSEADYARLTRTSSLIGRSVQITLRRGMKNDHYDGHVIRVDARVDAATGGRRLFAGLSDLTLDTDLRPGLFSEVTIPDDLYPNVIVLPVQALHDNSYVYVVQKDRLQKRDVSLAAFDGEQVLIAQGLAPGEQVCLTRFAEMGPGIKVQVVDPS